MRVLPGNGEGQLLENAIPGKGDDFHLGSVVRFISYIESRAAQIAIARDDADVLLTAYSKARAGTNRCPLHSGDDRSAPDGQESRIKRK